MNLGYACINTVLKENNIFTNRTMRRKTFDAKGLDYVSDLSLQNVKDLKTHILWNDEHDIKLFRLSSQIFPWMEEYEFSDLKDFNEIKDLMLECGNIATESGQRLTMHPGPYHCLASPTPKVVKRTVIGLDKHAEQFDMMGFEPSHYNKINIHVGGAYGDKEAALEAIDNKYYKALKRLFSIYRMSNNRKEAVKLTRFFNKTKFYETNSNLKAIQLMKN